jgi:hypothetical protein
MERERAMAAVSFALACCSRFALPSAEIANHLPIEH